MTNTVRCKVTQCKYNGGMFCTRPFVFIEQGVCDVLVDKNGNWRNPIEWQKQYSPDKTENDEQNIQTT